MPDQQQCTNCGKTIAWSKGSFVWQHTDNGFALCFPFTTEPESKLTATPPPPNLPTITFVDHSRTSGTIAEDPHRPVHLVPALNKGYVTACGKQTRSAVKDINQTTVKADVTCSPCQRTMKYKNMEDPVTEARNEIMKDICANCALAITKQPGTRGDQWFHSGTSGLYCHNGGRNGHVATPRTKSRTSESFKDDRSTTDPVQAALMQIHPNLCLAIYGHVGETGMKQYCSKVRNHPFQCGDPTVEELQAKAYELDPDPEPKAPRRSVYCVHCQQRHSPDDDHRVSFDYPPIPYARQLFEQRAKELTDLMFDYINGDINWEDMERSTRDADLGYIQKMHDLYALRLI